MDLETKWLRDFIALAETRNFSQAAKLRHVTQPAFSRRIQALESAIDIALINRLRQPLQLTDSGKFFLSKAKEIIHQIELVDEHLQLNKTEISIVFAATHTLSVGVFPTVLQYLNELPFKVDTQLKVANADDCVNLLTHKRCDYLLAFSDPLLKNYQDDAIVLGKVKLLPVCQADESGLPRFQLANKDKITPYLAYQKNIYLGRVVSQLIKKNQDKLNISQRLESPMADSLKMMALKGLGVAWIPEFSILDELHAKKLAIAGEAQWQPELELSVYRAKKQKEPHDSLDLIWQKISNITL